MFDYIQRNQNSLGKYIFFVSKLCETVQENALNYVGFYQQIYVRYKKDHK